MCFRRAPVPSQPYSTLVLQPVYLSPVQLYPGLQTSHLSPPSGICLVTMASSPQISDIKSCTLVITYPKGSKFVYSDFDTLLSKFHSEIECFSTVGVGYVWNVTFRSVHVIDAVLALTEDGNFFCEGSYSNPRY
jgi:hypothetical protein